MLGKDLTKAQQFHGVKEIWDFTCTDTSAASYINLTKDHAGAAAELAVQRKYAKYIYRYLILFVLAVDTMGGWCEQGKEWAKQHHCKLNTRTSGLQQYVRVSVFTLKWIMP